MKIFFLNFIKKSLYRIGIHVQYYPSPKHFYQFLKDKPSQVKEYELRKITANIRDTNNHKFYEELLQLFIPEWSLKTHNPIFIGKGFSQSSIKAFRRLTIENKLYFEKIYFNSYKDLERVQWFQEHVYELVKDKISAPPILKVFSGESLTAVYYEYKVLKNLDKAEREYNFVQVSKDLYQLSFVNESAIFNRVLPESIKDFRDHFLYKAFAGIAFAKLKKQGIRCNELEDLISESKLALTHGDIFEGNCFEDNVLIDWDTFGLFPIGFDPAFIFHRLLVRDGSTTEFLGWLKQHYQDIVLEKDWDKFERNFVWFLFIFASNTFSKGLYSAVEQQLIEKIKTFKSADNG